MATKKKKSQSGRPALRPEAVAAMLAHAKQHGMLLEKEDEDGIRAKGPVYPVKTGRKVEWFCQVEVEEVRGESKALSCWVQKVRAPKGVKSFLKVAPLKK